MKQTVAVALLAFLPACAQPPKPFPDFCMEQHRVIPRDERIIAALTYAAANHHGRLPHFIAFRTAIRRNMSNRDDRLISQAYLARHPDCCDVVLPWVVSEYYRNGSYLFGNEAADNFFREFRRFHWSRDILIAELPPLNTSNRDKLGREKFVRIQSSSCGVATQLVRG